MKNKYIRRGFNVKNIIKQFALEQKISELSLDYSLTSYQTYLLRDNSIDVNTIIDFDSPYLKSIDPTKISTFVDSPYKMIQSYTIEIFSRESSFYPIIINIQSSEDNISLKALIDTKRIPNDGNLESIIKSTILNICAYRGIIIGLGWSNFNSSIREVATKLRSSIKHPEYYELNIASLPSPKIIYPAVKKIISKNINLKVLSTDSSLLNGGFFKVNKGDILLEYQKPTYEADWRNIYGNIYGINGDYPVGILPGTKIGTESKNNTIFYCALDDGYVSIVGNTMQISDVVTLDNINNINITNIEEENINTLLVKNDNLTKDIVSSGINLNIDNLGIIGNVGAVNIISKQLSIKGQVHIKSYIKSEAASILHFKGRLESQNANIRFCENANVEVDNLIIDTVGGSKVYTTNAKISHVKSNNVFFVQNNLSIGRFIGRNNEFILHPCLYGASKAKLDSLNLKIENINKLKNLFSSFIIDVKYNNEINKFLYEELNLKDPSRFNSNLFNWDAVVNNHREKYNNSQKIMDRYEELLSSLDSKIINFSEEISSMLNSIFNIKIIFENKCNVDFYVKIINMDGSESKYHINSNGDTIGSIGLSKDGDNIKIVVFRE